ncbi:MAG: hypothetical protein JSR18_05385 [Proteobacteria bacterium]|nr:hypothetical protein [Pseudomonadota bacterium]
MMIVRVARLLPLVALLGACATGGDPMVPSEDTVQCQMQGQRIVIRFVDQEARLLMPPNGERINLYQIGSTMPGQMRFSNGLMELTGTNKDLRLTKDGQSMALVNCEPLMVPKKSNNPFLNM